MQVPKYTWLVLKSSFLMQNLVLCSVTTVASVKLNQCQFLLGYIWKISKIDRPLYFNLKSQPSRHHRKHFPSLPSKSVTQASRNNLLCLSNPSSGAHCTKPPKSTSSSSLKRNSFAQWASLFFQTSGPAGTTLLHSPQLGRWLISATTSLLPSRVLYFIYSLTTLSQESRDRKAKGERRRRRGGGKKGIHAARPDNL